MLKVEYTKKFKKEYKKIQKRGFDIQKLKIVVDMLRKQQPLPDKYRNHKLSGEYANCWECHIEPDWLLIYIIENDILTLTLTATGTHSDLF